MESGNISKFEPSKITPYHQYKDVEEFQQLFGVVNEMIKEFYTEIIAEWMEALRLDPDCIELHPYFTYYMRYYFGIMRPLSAASLLPSYDVGDKWDNNLIYDYGAGEGGTIEDDQFCAMLKWTINWQIPISNIHNLLDFACAFIGISRRDIRVSSLVNGLMIELPKDLRISADFVRLIDNYYNEIGYPFGLFIDFRLRSDTWIIKYQRKYITRIDEIAVNGTYKVKLLSDYGLDEKIYGAWIFNKQYYYGGQELFLPDMLRYAPRREIDFQAVKGLLVVFDWEGGTYRRLFDLPLNLPNGLYILKAPLPNGYYWKDKNGNLYVIGDFINLTALAVRNVVILKGYNDQKAYKVRYIVPKKGSYYIEYFADGNNFLRVYYKAQRYNVEYKAVAPGWMVIAVNYFAETGTYKVEYYAHAMTDVYTIEYQAVDPLAKVLKVDYYAKAKHLKVNYQAVRVGGKNYVVSYAARKKDSKNYAVSYAAVIQGKRNYIVRYFGGVKTYRVWYGARSPKSKHILVHYKAKMPYSVYYKAVKYTIKFEAKTESLYAYIMKKWEGWNFLWVPRSFTFIENDTRLNSLFANVFIDASEFTNYQLKRGELWGTARIHSILKYKNGNWKWVKKFEHCNKVFAGGTGLFRFKSLAGGIRNINLIPTLAGRTFAPVTKGIYDDILAFMVSAMCGSIGQNSPHVMKANTFSGNIQLTNSWIAENSLTPFSYPKRQAFDNVTIDQTGSKGDAYAQQAAKQTAMILSHYLNVSPSTAVKPEEKMSLTKLKKVWEDDFRFWWGGIKNTTIPDVQKYEVKYRGDRRLSVNYKAERLTRVNYHAARYQVDYNARKVFIVEYYAVKYEVNYEAKRFIVRFVYRPPLILLTKKQTPIQVNIVTRTEAYNDLGSVYVENVLNSSQALTQNFMVNHLLAYINPNFALYGEGRADTDVYYAAKEVISQAAPDGDIAGMFHLESIDDIAYTIAEYYKSNGKLKTSVVNGVGSGRGGNLNRWTSSYASFPALMYNTCFFYHRSVNSNGSLTLYDKPFRRPKDFKHIDLKDLSNRIVNKHQTPVNDRLQRNDVTLAAMIQSKATQNARNRCVPECVDLQTIRTYSEIYVAFPQVYIEGYEKRILVIFEAQDWQRFAVRVNYKASQRYEVKYEANRIWPVNYKAERPWFINYNAQRYIVKYNAVKRRWYRIRGDSYVDGISTDTGSVNSNNLNS